jgi:hypothetical protein
LDCKELFLPDYRGGQRQCYCLKAAFLELLENLPG